MFDPTLHGFIEIDISDIDTTRISLWNNYNNWKIFIDYSETTIYLRFGKRWFEKYYEDRFFTPRLERGDFDEEIEKLRPLLIKDKNVIILKNNG